MNVRHLAPLFIVGAIVSGLVGLSARAQPVASGKPAMPGASGAPSFRPVPPSSSNAPGSGSSVPRPSASAASVTPAGSGSSYRAFPSSSASASGSQSRVPFDRGAAATALASINLADCKKPGGPTGSGHVKVTFNNEGLVTMVDVDADPYRGTSVGGCIAGKLRVARVPRYDGSPVTVGKAFTL